MRISTVTPTVMGWMVSTAPGGVVGGVTVPVGTNVGVNERVGLIVVVMAGVVSVDGVGVADFGPGMTPPTNTTMLITSVATAVTTVTRIEITIANILPDNMFHVRNLGPEVEPALGEPNQLASWF
jgi:hypothetical protein